MILALHHVQSATPEGDEAAARRFHEGVLGLSEVTKPAVLAGRGGVRSEAGSGRVPRAVEAPFAAAHKAHPAFEVASLDAAFAEVVRRRDADLPGIARIFVADPFGNRIEILQMHAEA